MVVLGTTASPGSAATTEHVVHSGTQSTASDPEWPCEFDVQVIEDWRETVTVVAKRGGEIPYFHVRSVGSITFAANGHTYTDRFAVNDKDQRITVAGSELLIDGAAAGREDWYVDGTRVFHNPGALRYSFRVLHNGTLSNPDDDTFVKDSFTITKPSTGVNDGPTQGFCEDLVEFLDLG